MDSANWTITPTKSLVLQSVPYFIKLQTEEGINSGWVHSGCLDGNLKRRSLAGSHSLSTWAFTHQAEALVTSECCLNHVLAGSIKSSLLTQRKTWLYPNQLEPAPEKCVALNQVSSTWGPRQTPRNPHCYSRTHII